MDIQIKPYLECNKKVSYRINFYNHPSEFPTFHISNEQLTRSVRFSVDITSKRHLQPFIPPRSQKQTTIGMPRDIEIPCGNCKQTYIGQTNGGINVNREDHQISIRSKKTTSSLVQHMMVTEDSLNFNGTMTLANMENHH